MREPEDNEREDEDEDEGEESPPPPKAKPAAGLASDAARSKSAAPKGPTTVPSSGVLAVGLIALVVGGAVGWFGQIQQAKAARHAQDAAAPVGSGAPSGACGLWKTKICASTGEQSASCQQAKAAADLLMPSSCDVALTSMPDTLARVKVQRASCDKLVAKLCGDLPPGSKTCKMVQERTPSFPSERCDQMFASYDKVIAELRQMDQRGPGMGGPPGGAPHMAPGMPGAMPHITLPPPGASHP